MGFSYRIEGNVAVAEVEGSVVANDLRRHLLVLTVEPELHAGMPALIDCRNATIVLTADDLRAIATEARRITTGPTPRRCAILAASDVAFGLIRMYEVFSDGSAVEVRAFRERGEAIEWLTGASGD